MDRQTVVRELPSALAMATLTAIVTLLLAVGLSWAVGAEARDQRADSRCYQATILMELHEIRALITGVPHRHGAEAIIALSQDCIDRLQAPVPSL